MNMKQINFFYAIIFFISVFLIQSCKHKNNFIVEVNFEQQDSTPLRLYLLAENNTQLVDSVYLKEENHAELIGNTENASLYLLKFFNDQSIFLVIHPEDKIRIEVNNLSSEIFYYVKGSPDSRLVKNIIDKQNIVLKTIDQLSLEWENNRLDSSLLKKIDSSYAAILKEHQNYTKDFIYANPASLASILALYQNFGKKSQPLFDKYDDLDIFNFVDSNLTILYPHTEAVKALNREVTETKEQIAHNRYIEKRILEGAPLPDLDEISLAGDTILINDETNISVLLFFWASWNSFSVDELLLLNSYYKNSKLENIKIITISLDASKEILNSFLKNNSIELDVICDFNYWESELAGRYAVKRIPSNILTNKSGIIVSKDILSDELITKIKDIEK